MMNIAIILSIKNWAFSAEYGLASVTFLLFSILCFFIPMSLITAELATTFPELGGPYIWVREAFGKRAGFFAMWFLWLQNVVWYPSILVFILGSIGHVFFPEALKCPYFTVSMILLLFWIVTAVALFGLELTAKLSSFFAIIGTIIPGVAIITLGAFWLFSEKATAISLEWSSLIPKDYSFASFAFLSGIILNFFGMEVSAIHAKDVNKPSRDYPLAIFVSAILIALLSIFGVLSIALIIPKQEINLVSGFIEAISILLNSFNLSYLIAPFTVMIALGAFGGMSSWTIGPSRGLLAVAKDANLPSFFTKLNRYGMPYFLLIAQACIVSILAFVFFLMPSMNSAFWILVTLTAELYFLFYIFVIGAFFKLRYKKKKLERPYKVPFGKPGMWIFTLLPLCMIFIGMSTGFILPENFQQNSTISYQILLTMALVLFCVIPLFITFKRGKEND